MPTAELILRLAMEGSRVECVELAGMPRHMVVQRALRLATDPEVAMAHPELVQRISERAERQRAARMAPGMATW